MGLFNRVRSFFDDWDWSASSSSADQPPGVNPATGLPMMGAIDVGGNPFGTDLSSHHQDDWHHTTHDTGSKFDDHHHSSWNDHHSTWNDHHSWHDTSSFGGSHDPSRD